MYTMCLYFGIEWYNFSDVRSICADLPSDPVLTVLTGTTLAGFGKSIVPQGFTRRGRKTMGKQTFPPEPFGWEQDLGFTRDPFGWERESTIAGE